MDRSLECVPCACLLRVPCTRRAQHTTTLHTTAAPSTRGSHPPPAGTSAPQPRRQRTLCTAARRRPRCRRELAAGVRACGGAGVQGCRGAKLRRRGRAVVQGCGVWQVRRCAGRGGSQVGPGGGAKGWDQGVGPRGGAKVWEPPAAGSTCTSRLRRRRRRSASGASQAAPARASTAR